MAKSKPKPSATEQRRNRSIGFIRRALKLNAMQKALLVEQRRALLEHLAALENQGRRGAEIEPDAAEESGDESRPRLAG